MVSSVVSTLQVEDPTRSGIVNKGPVTRSQDFTRMDDQYTFVIYRPASIAWLTLSYILSARLPWATIRRLCIDLLLS
jgi:hypothetical protein